MKQLLDAFEALDEMYLEWSKVTDVRTEREEALINGLREVLRDIREETYDLEKLVERLKKLLIQSV